MTPSRAMLICRTQSPAADGWYHLYPRGEFEVTASIHGKDQDVDLILDDDAFKAILAARDEDAKAANWAGYLVGQEHFSQMQDQSSEAHAWCRELEIRADGLWGKFEKTPLGEASIGSVYKFRSPVSDLVQISGRGWRPVNLVDIGLTNKPKFKSLAAATGRDGGDTTKPESAMREKLIALLGLDADATDEQILAAVTASKDETKTVKAEMMAREADAFVAEHEDLIPETDRASVKANYIAARDVTKSIYSSMRKGHPKTVKPAQRLLSREEAKTPTTPTTEVTDGGATNELSDADVARISARARDLRKSGTCSSLSAAYTQATAEFENKG